jgi:hypothetical protein
MFPYSPKELNRRELLIMEYFYRHTFFYENEETQLRNNFALRKMDELDHLELIMLLTRIKAFRKISTDIHAILTMSL